MNIQFVKSILFLLTISLFSCNNTKDKSVSSTSNTDVHVVGAMKDVMWKGELKGKISLDTIQNKIGLYGIGPESYLTGEILIMEGKSYVSRVVTDSTMLVKETYNTAAPFFVYANVIEWETIKVPAKVKDMLALEQYIDSITKEAKRPFAFKVSGKVSEAVIHIQNLPKGASVSSPEEAHQGQIDYNLIDEAIDIVGFFSTEHKAIFTHHDSFMHLHLISKDKSKMGHLDSAVFEDLTLYLPRN
jgi:acetolactate decarboxylase